MSRGSSLLAIVLAPLTLQCGARSGLLGPQSGTLLADGTSTDAADATRDAPDGGPPDPCRWSAATPLEVHRPAPPFGELYLGGVFAGATSALVIWWEGTAIFSGDFRLRYGARAIAFDGSPRARDRTLAEQALTPGSFGTPHTRAAQSGAGFVSAIWFGRSAPELSPCAWEEMDALGQPLRTSRMNLPVGTQCDDLHAIGDRFRFYSPEGNGDVRVMDVDRSGQPAGTGAVFSERTTLRREFRADGSAVELMRASPTEDIGFVVQSFTLDGRPMWSTPWRLAMTLVQTPVMTHAVAGDLTVIAHNTRGTDGLVVEALDPSGLPVWRRDLALPLPGGGHWYAAQLVFAEGELLVLTLRTGGGSHELFAESLALDGRTLQARSQLWTGAANASLESAVAVPGGALVAGRTFGSGFTAVVQSLRCGR